LLAIFDHAGIGIRINDSFGARFLNYYCAKIASKDSQKSFSTQSTQWEYTPLHRKATGSELL